MASAGDVHEDAAHHLRRHAKEVAAVLPSDGIPAEQPQADFVDETGRLHRMIAALTREVAVSHAVQLAVDEWDQPVEGVLVAFAPDLKQTRDVPVRRSPFRRHSAWAFSFGRGVCHGDGARGYLAKSRASLATEMAIPTCKGAAAGEKVQSRRRSLGAVAQFAR